MKYIYKFYNINENTLDSLKNSYLYFAKPSQLNDPFDCKIRYYIKGTDEEKRDYIRSTKLKPTNNKYYEYIKYLNNPKLLDDKFNKNNIEKANDTISVLSLTENPHNTLMWSHYAENHSGICIKIELNNYNDLYGIKFKGHNFNGRHTNLVPPGFIFIKKINYSETMPVQNNILNRNIEDMAKYLYTKHENWKYEQEWRAVIYDKFSNSKQKITYNPRKLCGIIFGDKTKIDNIDLIKNVFKEKNCQIDYYKAIPSTVEYKMDIIDL